MRRFSIRRIVSEMKVDKLIPYGKTRTKVLFEEGLVLLLYNGEIKKYGLAEGSYITDEFYNTRLVPALSKRAKERIVFILKSSDKPENELRRKLKEGFYPEEAINDAVEWAKSKHYVDDSRYVETYIRYHGEGKSKKKLLYDLASKGISRELILNMLEDAEIDESSQIVTELRKRGYNEELDPKEKQRITAALARKGYSWEAINSAMREC